MKCLTRIKKKKNHEGLQNKFVECFFLVMQPISDKKLSCAFLCIVKGIKLSGLTVDRIHGKEKTGIFT